MQLGVPSVLPGRQQNFENAGSVPPAVGFCLQQLIA